MEIKDGMYVQLGRGLPKLVHRYTQKGIDIDYFTENGLMGFEYGKGEYFDEEYYIGSVKKGGAVMKSSDAFSVMRRGKLDLIITEAEKVNSNFEVKMCTCKLSSFHSSFD